jgi:hypothetical protein
MRSCTSTPQYASMAWCSVKKSTATTSPLPYFYFIVFMWSINFPEVSVKIHKTLYILLILGGLILRILLPLSDSPRNPVFHYVLCVFENPSHGGYIRLVRSVYMSFRMKESSNCRKWDEWDTDAQTVQELQIVLSFCLYELRILQSLHDRKCNLINPRLFP